MAGKAKSVYICSECGYESPKWFGCCPGCGEWNTMNEEIKAPAAPASKSGASARSVKTYALSEITAMRRYAIRRDSPSSTAFSAAE